MPGPKRRLPTAAVALAGLVVGIGIADVAGAAELSSATVPASPAASRAAAEPSGTTTTPAVAAPTTSTTAAPDGVPAEGEATEWGCPAALAYLHAYADPFFSIECAVSSGPGSLAETCWSGGLCGPDQALIVITVPCPVAYMNEAHNSWVVHRYGSIPGGVPPPGSIDPFGERC